MCFLQTGLTVKGELAELLDTLIDLQQSYPLSDPSGTPATPFHHKLHSLLPLLLSAYGATLSSPDQSLLRVLLHINNIVYHSLEHQQALQHQDQAAAAAAATADAASNKDAAMTAGINEHADKPNEDAVGDAGHAVGDADDDSNAEGQGGVAHGPITAMLHGPLATAGSVSFCCNCALYRAKRQICSSHIQALHASLRLIVHTMLRAKCSDDVSEMALRFHCFNMNIN